MQRVLLAWIIRRLPHRPGRLHRVDQVRTLHAGLAAELNHRIGRPSAVNSSPSLAGGSLAAQCASLACGDTLAGRQKARKRATRGAWLLAASGCVPGGLGIHLHVAHLSWHHLAPQRRRSGARAEPEQRRAVPPGSGRNAAFPVVCRSTSGTGLVSAPDRSAIVGLAHGASASRVASARGRRCRRRAKTALVFAAVLRDLRVLIGGAPACGRGL